MSGRREKLNRKELESKGLTKKSYYPDLQDGDQTFVRREECGHIDGYGNGFIFKRVKPKLKKSRG